METKQSRLPTQRAPRPARTKSNAVTANVASSSNGIGSANHEDAKVRVRFKITANGAQAVAVAGTFNDWEAEKTPLLLLCGRMQFRPQRAMLSGMGRTTSPKSQV